MGISLRPEPYLTPLATATAVALAITAFGADGYTATYPSPPTGPQINYSAAGVTVPGYRWDEGTDTVSLVNNSEAIKFPYRKRTLYGTGHPSDGSLTTDTVTSGTWICSNYSAAGVTNNSTLVSPKPVGAWGTYDRGVVNNSITARWKIYHWAARNQKQVPVTELRASDGVTTVRQRVKLTTSTYEAASGLYVEEYVVTLNISALAPGPIALDVMAWPWVAASDGSSILDTATNTGGNRGFTTRHYLKDPQRASLANGGSLGRPTAVVDLMLGNNSTGTWGTEGMHGMPFATIEGAMLAQSTSGRSIANAGYNAIPVQYGGVTNHNVLDGAQILVNPGTHVVGGTGTTRAQTFAKMYIRRNPLTTSGKADVTLQFAGWRPRLGVTGMALASAEGGAQFEEVTIQRTSTAFFAGETGSGLEVFFRDCTFDNNSQAAGWLQTGTNTACDLHWGTAFINISGNGGLASSGSTDRAEHRMLRGCTGTIGGGVEQWNIQGCRWIGGSTISTARTNDGSIVAETAFFACTGQTWEVGGALGGGWDITIGAVLANCVIEPIHTTSSSTGIGVSRDSANKSTVQAIVIGNTILAAEGLGRSNLLYCDKGTTGTARTHTFFCVKGNIFGNLYVKGDQFVFSNNNGSPSPADSATFIGHLPFVYGVNCAGNVQMWQTAANGAGSSEGPIYIGEGSVRPAPGVLTELANVNFVDPKSTTYTATPSPTWTAGAGQGDYRLNTGSVAKSIVPESVLAFTMDGAARSASNDNAGARMAA